jgi:nucleotide-binding universal stress UspA family protein
MALVTTFATTPLLYLIFPRRLLEKATGAKAGFTVLIPVAAPGSGRRLVHVANLLSGPNDADRRILALHLERSADHQAFSTGLNASDNANQALRPLLDYAQTNQIPVEAISSLSRDIAVDIARTARERGADLVLIGFHRPVFGRTILGGKVHRVLTGADTDVAVFVDRGLDKPKRVLVPHMAGPHDRLAMELAQRLARGSGAEVTILHVVPKNHETDHESEVRSAVDEVFANAKESAAVNLRVIESNTPAQTVIDESANYDLVVIGVSDEWGLSSHLFGWRPERIASQSTASLLIVRKHATAPAIVAATEAAKAQEEAVAAVDGI